jgi:Domain of unknown function (DUF4276)
VVNEIRLYVEGGGDGKETKARMRQGLHAFLQKIVDLARSQRVKWQIIACGPRSKAFSVFEIALATHPEAYNILLVDAEGPVYTPPWLHLQNRDNWRVSGVADQHCHLMVQTMEAWLIVDREALARFYGAGFGEGALPRHANVEHIDKSTLVSALQAATRHTSKGEYHKIRHGCVLLAQLESTKVRRAAPHCERLFTTLEGLLA